MKFRYEKETNELVISESTRIEYHQLNIWLTRKIKDHRFNPLVKLGVWNGEKTYFRNGRVNFGLWRECVKACKEIGVKFELENKEEFPLDKNLSLDDVKKFCELFFKYHQIPEGGKLVKFFPYDHQIETAFKILKNKFVLGEVATSGGKSLIVSIIFFYILKNINPNAKFLIIVPSINLVTQFYNDLISNNYGYNRIEGIKNNMTFESDYSPCDIRIEEVMSDQPRLHIGDKDPNIYIGTYQSLEKWPEDFFKKFNVVSCDEAHKCKSKSLVSILERTFKSAEYRFGVSGTFPPDNSLEILTIQSVLGPKILEVTADDLKKKEIITPMEIKAIVINHDDQKFDSQLSEIRRGGMGKEAFELEKEYIHNSTKRFELIKKIVEKCDKNTLILFYTIEYGNQLLRYLSKSFPDREFYYIDGEVKNKERNEIKNKLEEESSKIKIAICSYGTTAVGISVKNLHYLILADSFKSEQIIIQAIGRLLRKKSGKDKSIIFDLVDIFKTEDAKNAHYKHFKIREEFYIRRKYPYKIFKVNI